MRKLFSILTLLGIMPMLLFYGCKEEFSEEDFVRQQQEEEQKRNSVNYVVNLIDGTHGGYVSVNGRVASFDSAFVTLNMGDTLMTKMTNSAGMVEFPGVLPGQVGVTVEAPGYTSVKYTVDILNIEGVNQLMDDYNYEDDESAESDSIFQVDDLLKPDDYVNGYRQVTNSIVLFSTMAEDMATISGTAVAELDLTNRVLETVPEGVVVYATIDVGSEDFKNRYMADSIKFFGYELNDVQRQLDQALYLFTRGRITDMAYATIDGMTTTAADGSFSLNVPGATQGLPVEVVYSDFSVANQRIGTVVFDADGKPVPEVREVRADFGPTISSKYSYSAIPEALGVHATVEAAPIAGSGFSLSAGSPSPRTIVDTTYPFSDADKIHHNGQLITITEGGAGYKGGDEDENHIDVNFVDADGNKETGLVIPVLEGAFASITVQQSEVHDTLEYNFVIDINDEDDYPYVEVGAGMEELVEGQATVNIGAEINGDITLDVNSYKGSGYITPPAVTFPPAGTGETQAEGYATIDTYLKEVQVTNPGSGYTKIPDVTFADPNTGGSTDDFAAIAALSASPATISVTKAGSGYLEAPTVKIIGTGVDGNSRVEWDATATLNSAVSSINIDAGGSYVMGNQITIADLTIGAPATGGTQAEASVELLGQVRDASYNTVSGEIENNTAYTIIDAGDDYETEFTVAVNATGQSNTNYSAATLTASIVGGLKNSIGTDENTSDPQNRGFESDNFTVAKENAGDPGTLPTEYSITFEGEVSSINLEAQTEDYTVAAAGTYYLEIQNDNLGNQVVAMAQVTVTAAGDITSVDAILNVDESGNQPANYQDNQVLVNTTTNFNYTNSVSRQYTIGDLYDKIDGTGAAQTAGTTSAAFTTTTTLPYVQVDNAIISTNIDWETANASGDYGSGFTEASINYTATTAPNDGAEVVRFEVVSGSTIVYFYDRISGEVSGLTFDNFGANYEVDNSTEFSFAPSNTVGGSGFLLDGDQIVIDGEVASVGIDVAGSNYTSTPSVTLADQVVGSSTFNGAAFTAEIAGTIVDITVSGTGSPMMYGDVSSVQSVFPNYFAPFVAIGEPRTGGAQAEADIADWDGELLAVFVSADGSGVAKEYVAPNVAIIRASGDLTGAGATATAVMDGQVDEVVVTEPGYYKYSSYMTPVPTIAASSTGDVAEVHMDDINLNALVESVTVVDGGKYRINANTVIPVTIESDGVKKQDLDAELNASIVELQVGTGTETYGVAPTIEIMGGSPTTNAAAEFGIWATKYRYTIDNAGSGYAVAPTAYVDASNAVWFDDNSVYYDDKYEEISGFDPGNPGAQRSLVVDKADGSVSFRPDIFYIETAGYYTAVGNVRPLAIVKPMARVTPEITLSVDNGKLTGVTLDVNGSGYDYANPPTVTVFNVATGASFTDHIVIDPVLIANGLITNDAAFVIVEQGAGFSEELNQYAGSNLGVKFVNDLTVRPGVNYNVSPNYGSGYRAQALDGNTLNPIIINQREDVVLENK